MERFIANWQIWLWSAALVVGAVVVAIVAHRMIFAAAHRITKRKARPILGSIIRYGEKPAQLILLLAVIEAVMPLLPLPPKVALAAERIAGLGLIACVGWLLIALVQVFDELVAYRHSVDVRENLAARRIRTQVQMLRRVAVSVIVIVTAGVMLMTIPAIRHVGESLLASAGLAAIVTGFAAQSTLSNLLAGIQVAFTQPIRLGDAVVVEGEWGWIEEINITYVVVRIWDLRRLVVPVSYFIQKPFQNWTRDQADLLGTVLLYADYSVPVEAVRNQLHHVLETSKLWDGKVWGLQVTNATDRTVELRALMSAPNSPTAWDLRCHVREKLILFLQEQFPQSLPRIRAEVLRGENDTDQSQGRAA